MTTKLTPKELKDQRVNVNVRGGSADAVYGLGLIGAWMYYIGRANTTEERVKGFFKGLVWPVFMVKGLFEYLDQA